MTDALTEAIIDRLITDSELDGLLARSVIDPLAPAVYATVPVPVSAVMPYVVAEAGDVVSLNEDVMNAADGGYRRVIRDIGCYDTRPNDGGGDASTVQAIGERVRTLFHRQPLELAGDARNLVATATGPIVNNGDTAFGRVVSVAFLVAEPIAV